MDPASAHFLMPYPILTEGLKQDHPEWFEDEDELDQLDDPDAEDEADDRWGAQPGQARL